MLAGRRAVAGLGPDSMDARRNRGRVWSRPSGAQNAPAHAPRSAAGLPTLQPWRGTWRSLCASRRS